MSAHSYDKIVNGYGIIVCVDIIKYAWGFFLSAFQYSRYFRWELQ